MVSLPILSIKNFFEILQINYTTVFIGMLHVERSNRRFGELNPSRKGEWGGATPILHNFHILNLERAPSHFVACLVFLRIAFSFSTIIFSSETSTKRKADVTEYDAITDQ